MAKSQDVAATAASAPERRIPKAKRKSSAFRRNLTRDHKHFSKPKRSHNTLKSTFRNTVQPTDSKISTAGTQSIPSLCDLLSTKSLDSPGLKSTSMLKDAAKQLHDQQQDQENISTLCDVFPEPSQHIDPDPNPAEGRLCVLRSYDLRYNVRGEADLLETSSKTEIKGPEGPNPEAALVLVRAFTGPNNEPSNRLEIRSPYIKTALRSVIKSYPGVNIHCEGNIILYDQPWCLFHFRHELEQYANECEDLEAKKHVELCLQYMRRALQREIATYDQIMKADKADRGIEFDLLWMVYKPGALLSTMYYGIDTVMRFVSMHKIEVRDSPPKWSIDAELIDYDGKCFGLLSRPVIEFPWNGRRLLVNLINCPLESHPDGERIRHEMFARGRKFVSVRDCEHAFFEGSADVVNNIHTYAPSGICMQVSERIVVDRLQKRHIQSGPISFRANGDSFCYTKEQVGILSDEDLMICTPTILGFLLRSKQWAYFDVAKIREVEFDMDSYTNLVLSKRNKHMIESLVRAWESECNSQFDDLIKARGKGAVFLLHGPPGVGKSFTAESIAEHLRRPLYAVTSSDLSHDVAKATDQLTDILERARKWNALILIDEADVFMAQRTLQDLKRSELVSVLLRALESFDGIMFLTSNRMKAIDPAFSSRIHCPIAYPHLGPRSRTLLWRTFLARSTTSALPSWVDDKFFDNVKKVPVNGRQIKNAIRVATTIAADQKRELLAKDIYSILHTLQAFDADFKRQSPQMTRRKSRIKSRSRSATKLTSSRTP